MNKEQYYSDIIAELSRAVQSAVGIIAEQHAELTEARIPLSTRNAPQSTLPLLREPSTPGGTRAQLETLRTESDQAISSLRFEIDSLKEGNMRLSVERDEANKRATETANRLNEDRQKLSDVRAKLTVAERQIEELRGELTNAVTGLKVVDQAGDDREKALAGIKQERDFHRSEFDRIVGRLNFVFSAVHQLLDALNERYGQRPWPAAPVAHAFDAVVDAMNGTETSFPDVDRLTRFVRAVKHVHAEYEEYGRTGEPEPLNQAIEALWPLINPDAKPQGD